MARQGLRRPVLRDGAFLCAVRFGMLAALHTLITHYPNPDAPARPKGPKTQRLIRIVEIPPIFGAPEIWLAWLPR
jgi:hypothetical protein